MVRKKKSSEFDNSSRVLLANVKHGSKNHKAAKRLTQIARRISNRANFIMRKDLFTGRKPDQSKVDKLLKQARLSEGDKALYNRLPAAVSQRSIQIVGDNWKSFAAAKADYKKSPEKYESAPKPPKYSKHSKTVYIPCSSFFIKGNQLHFAKKLELNPISLKRGMFPDQKYNEQALKKVVNEVRLVPTGSGFRFEIVYDMHKTSDFSSSNHSVLFDKSSFISIDLGVSRFAALVSNKAGFNPILINGGELKRINQSYNKRCAKLRSLGKHSHIKTVAAKRTRRIKDKLHKISRFIVDLCKVHDIGTVIVGKNHQWKKEINIGKRNNQNFVSLPHSMFISMLKYKLREFGIMLIEQEESYSSKASYVDGDVIPTYEKPKNGKEKKKYSFSGRRVKRGLYKTKENLLINADINGAACISRKAGYENASIVTGGVVNTPILVGL